MLASTASLLPIIGHGRAKFVSFFLIFLEFFSVKQMHLSWLEWISVNYQRLVLSNGTKSYFVFMAPFKHFKEISITETSPLARGAICASCAFAVSLAWSTYLLIKNNLSSSEITEAVFSGCHACRASMVGELYSVPKCVCYSARPPLCSHVWYVAWLGKE